MLFRSYEAQCSHCSGLIQFPSKGNFKCPRCNSFIAINEFGQQTLYASVNSHVFEVKYPCDNSFTSAFKASINSMAQLVGFSNVFCEEVGSAIENAISITIEKSASKMETYQVITVSDTNEMIIGIKSLNPFLVQGGQQDNRLRMIARKVDRLEVFPLPNKGQLLKMTKKKK